jgi:hypothetical protein
MPTSYGEARMAPGNPGAILLTSGGQMHRPAVSRMVAYTIASTIAGMSAQAVTTTA